MLFKTQAKLMSKALQLFAIYEIFSWMAATKLTELFITFAIKTSYSVIYSLLVKAFPNTHNACSTNIMSSLVRNWLSTLSKTDGVLSVSTRSILTTLLEPADRLPVIHIISSDKYF